MHVPTAITLLGVGSLALAAPAPAAAPKKFALKAHIVKAAHPSSHSNFGGSFVSAIHTGAGTNDVSVVPKKEDGLVAFINGTQLQFDFPGTQFPFLAQLPTLVQYSAWQAVNLNSISGPNAGHFFVNSTGVQWSSAKVAGSAQDEFGGWLVCDWWHSVPQLFWRNKYYNIPAYKGGVFADNCEAVQLLPVYV